jgi:uncharacterized membrane-anchored protein YjiN (DUF445 family)
MATVTTDERVVQLKRMRVIAGTLLALMLALFVAASALQARWPWLAYLRAFTEAAVVGACADWFAVVSIFRHPFGIPLPHTAVIPRHKQIIGENLGAFVANNFFAPAEVTARLERVDIAGWAAHWIVQAPNARFLAERLQALLPAFTDLLGDGRLHHLGSGLIRRGIDSIAAAPLAAKLLSVLVAHGHHEAVFDLLLERAQAFVDDHQDGIRERVSSRSASWVPNWVDARVTNAFLAELLKTLGDARDDAEHPWRIEFRGMLEGAVQRLATDEAILEHGERIKSEVLDHPVVDGYLAWLGEEIEQIARAETGAGNVEFVGYLERALVAAGHWFAANAELRAIANRWAQQLAFNAVVPNRSEIGRFISDVVARWDSRTLVDKLELQLGGDLQYIRINGTVIGGIVGLGIFVVGRLIG